MGRGIAAAALTASLACLAGASGASQESSYDAALGQLQDPSGRVRRDALRTLGRSRRLEAARPMAALLRDDDYRVQETAIEAVLGLYLVSDEIEVLEPRAWGPAAAGGRARSVAEAAFEAGPLAAIPGPVPDEALTGLAWVVRHDEDQPTRILAAYALGVLGAPHMGLVADATARQLANDVTYALQHRDSDTRQVVARVAGRLYRWTPGLEVPVAVGDALIAAMNDRDALVRRWAMDSLGWMRFERAVQALTGRATYHERGGAEGVAALHALARGVHPASAQLFAARLTSRVAAYRVIAIEGLARLEACGQLTAIGAAAAESRDPAAPLAAHFARFRCRQGEIGPIVAALDREATEQQARVYLEEIGTGEPAALARLLSNPNPAIRLLAVRIIGASRDARQENALQPLLKDATSEVVRAATEAIRRLRAYGGTAPAER